jgi:hypothetical protein
MIPEQQDLRETALPENTIGTEKPGVKIQEAIGLGPAAREETIPGKSIPDQGNLKRWKGKEMSGDDKLPPREPRMEFIKGERENQEPSPSGEWKVRDRVAIYVCKLYTECFLRSDSAGRCHISLLELLGAISLWKVASL